MGTELYSQYWNVMDPAKSSREFKDLFQTMTMHDSSKRPSFHQIRNHKWMSAPLVIDSLRIDSLKIDTLSNYEASPVFASDDEGPSP